MKSKLTITFLLLAIFIFSCSQKTNYGKPVEEPSTILKNIMSFLEYKERNIKLYKEFIGLDTSSNIISKEMFLKLLSTGNYLPLKMNSTDSTIYYKINKLDNTVDNDIKTTIKYWGLQEYDYYKLEGTEFPDYKFVDMEGKIYDNNSTKGKIVVIKCWFIACLPCVKEMPVLNEFRQRYLNQKDVLFISLCWDPKNKVESFLKKNAFTYSTVSDQYKFLTENLALNGYPTHFVLNKDGIILKKTQDYREMVYILEKLSLQ
jgi:peroxiredoxin